MLNKICIIGGGNIGTALAVEISQNINVNMVLLTSKPDLFKKKIFSIDMTTGERKHCELGLVTDNYEEALRDADLVLITVPSFLISDTIKKMVFNKKTMIGFIPGNGGREFFCKELINDGHIVFGVDRVPIIARIIKYGEAVSVSKKPEIRLASMTKKDTNDIVEMISNIFSITCLPLKNYLAVTLVPSNPILHTSRLYELFKNTDINTSFSEQIKFYNSWTDESSSTLLLMDDELQSLCKLFSSFCHNSDEYPLDLSEVVSLRKHYNSSTVSEMTEKIRSISSLKNINAPLVLINGKYSIDKESRYFTEDFPYGLCLIKAFAVIARINTPVIDKVLHWYEHFFSVKYYDDTTFSGIDLKYTGIPQNFGIKTIEDVVGFYS